ncbi:MAG: glycosyltransferase [Flavobacterium sp.]
MSFSNQFKPKIAVVVVTFNRLNELVKTIASIREQGFADNDIIVINNNSKDGTKELLDSNPFNKVKAIHLSDNIASAGGFARGMEEAFDQGYDWVWLFNDDSRPVSGTFDSFVGFLENEQALNLGLLKIANKNEKNQAVLLYWNGVRKPVYTNLSNELVKTDLITFDGCLISRKLMGQIGFCDPLYFMGTYEFDYCLKAKDAGFDIYTLPNGLIEDGKLGGIGGTPPWRQYYNTRNHLWLALNRKSLYILRAWFTRELKYTVAIILYSDRKIERLKFKIRAVRDAILNRRGKRYNPEIYSKIQ